MNVREAVEILATGREPRYRFEREFAFAMISALLLEPENDAAPDMGLLLAINHAIFLQQQRNVYIDIPSVISAYNPLFIKNNVAKYGAFIDIPMAFKIDDPYDSARYVADIVRFIINFPDKLNGRRVRPSLGRAYCFVNLEKGFRGTNFGTSYSWTGRTTHQRLWRKTRKYAAMEYVRFYENQINFKIDPRRDDYLFLLENEIGDRERVSGFFAKALWAQNKLLGVLDERATPDDAFFAFPRSLREISCKLYEFKRVDIDKCSRYSSSLLSSGILDRRRGKGV